MKREPGFYWVKLKGASEWMVAEYVQVSYGTPGSKIWYEWYAAGVEQKYKERDFKAIHETRLMPPD